MFSGRLVSIIFALPKTSDTYFESYRGESYEDNNCHQNFRPLVSRRKMPETLSKVCEGN